MSHCRRNLLGDFLTRSAHQARSDGVRHFRSSAGERRDCAAKRWRSAPMSSATWYTWLEQGRGGAPSADVLERIGRALMLTDAEREHLFLLALDRPPEVRSQAADGVTPQLQRVLDALALSPAYVKNARPGTSSPGTAPLRSSLAGCAASASSSATACVSSSAILRCARDDRLGT